MTLRTSATSGASISASSRIRPESRSRPHAHTDTSAKLIGYFKLASVHHYLIVDPEARTITHHARAGARVVLDDEFRLDPPGLTLTTADLLGPP